MRFLYITWHTPFLSTYFSPCGDCWLWDEQGGGLLSVRSLPGQLPRHNRPLHPLQRLPSSWSSSSVHYKEELQHLSLALAAFSVHPVRISRNLESHDNMEHQMGRMSFPSTAAGNTGGCIESMWSCLFGVRSRSDLRLQNGRQLNQLADVWISRSNENWSFKAFLD